ncbi:hypothetical protein UFOVP723_130 [uncultured Caudovirales phage]|uniref:Uncharacterized protein n=1 Tax=uncultured Caudovirales phage TaxID=2100421 RepID=A0A6J5NYK5_9CAUD|nr:hypothetical protein UFOVP723_130 [uncultured Caudovirales phage]
METRKYLFETLFKQFLTEGELKPIPLKQFEIEKQSIEQDNQVEYMQGDQNMLDAISSKARIEKYVGPDYKSKFSTGAAGGRIIVTIKRPSGVVFSGNSIDTYVTYIGS